MVSSLLERPDRTFTGPDRVPPIFSPLHERGEKEFSPLGFTEEGRWETMTEFLTLVVPGGEVL